MLPLSPVLLVIPLLLGSRAERAIAGRKEGAPDPHRPPCVTAECRAIKSFLKQHYCGESPFGNGPADGCDIRAHKRFGSPQIKAEPQCEWDDDGRSKCRQNGEVQPELRAITIRQMRTLGLPAGASGGVLFTVWQLPKTNWSLVEADYSNVSSGTLSNCEVILLVKPSLDFTVIREVRAPKTDADVPEGATWEFVDLVDVDGDGRPEIILEGDSYEDHWLEVVRMEKVP